MPVPACATALANACRCDRQRMPLHLPTHAAAIANACGCVDRPAQAERIGHYGAPFAPHACRAESSPMEAAGQPTQQQGARPPCLPAAAPPQDTDPTKRAEGGGLTGDKEIASARQQGELCPGWKAAQQKQGGGSDETRRRLEQSEKEAWPKRKGKLGQQKAARRPVPNSAPFRLTR